MQRPTGVCSLPNGNVAVADYDNKWVSIFDAAGKFVNKVGTGKLLGKKFQSNVKIMDYLFQNDF